MVDLQEMPVFRWHVVISISKAIFLLTLLPNNGNGDYSTLPACTDPTKEFQGYTYTQFEGRKVWTHCKFIHPDSEPELCGLTKHYEHVYLCDPDKLLKSGSDHANRISKLMYDFIAPLRKSCPKKSPEESIVLAFVMLDALRIGSASDPNSCLNDCGVLHPMITNTSIITEGDLEFSATAFVVGLIKSEWLIGRCDNQIVFLYSKLYNKFWAYHGADVAEQYGEEMLKTVYFDMRAVIVNRDKDTDLGEAMYKSLEIFVARLDDDAFGVTSPAYVLLICTLAFLLLLLIISLSVIFSSKRKEKLDKYTIKIDTEESP